MRWLILILTVVLTIPAVAQRPARGRPATPEAKKPADEKAAEKKPEEDAKAASEPVYLAVVGGDVHTATGPVLRGATVLVKDGKILEVGRDLVIPEGATLIDAAGKHVAPGFIATFANGIEGGGGDGSSDEDRAADRFDPYDQTMLQALATGITTVHTAPGGSGGFFGGGSAFRGSPAGRAAGVLSKSVYGTVEGYEVRQPAAVYLDYRAGSATSQERTKSVFRQAKEFLTKRKEWMNDALAGKKDLKPPQIKGDAANIVRVLDGELPMFVAAEDADDMRACLELSKEFGVKLSVVGGQEAWTMAAELARHGASVILNPRGEGGRNTRPYRNPLWDRPHGWSIENAAILTATGVPWATKPMSTGTAQSSNGLAGRDILGLPFEAAFAVRGGVSDLDALRSITLWAAERLLVADRLGSIEPGKDADLLVMDRAPMDYRSFVDVAVVNGEVRYRRSEHPLYSHINTDRSSGLGQWAPWGTWPELVTPAKKDRSNN